MVINGVGEGMAVLASQYWGARKIQPIRRAVAIALDEAVTSGRAKKGDIILLVTFGAGLTWSSAAIRL